MKPSPQCCTVRMSSQWWCCRSSQPFQIQLDSFSIRHIRTSLLDFGIDQSRTHGIHFASQCQYTYRSRSSCTEVQWNCRYSDTVLCHKPGNSSHRSLLWSWTGQHLQRGHLDTCGWHRLLGSSSHRSPLWSWTCQHLQRSHLDKCGWHRLPGSSSHR